MARLRYSSATAIASPGTTVEILLAPPEAGRALRYADLVMPDDSALSPPGVLATTPSGALPDFFGPDGAATLYALLDDGTTVTLSLAADTGSGTSSAFAGTTIGTSAMVGTAVVVTYSSVWGINGAGEAYYDAAGAVAGEAAVLMINPTTGAVVVTKPEGANAP